MELYNIDNLKKIAITYINIYIEKFYPNIDKRLLEQINNDLSKANISIEEMPKGSLIKGTNFDGNNITIYTEKGNITKENFTDLFETIIHELCHTLSRNSIDEKVKFIEEGYVVYLSNKILNYIISNKIRLNDCDNDLIFELFKDYQSKTGYENEKSLAIVNDTIMKKHNVDSVYEYFFNENGFDVLVEKARHVSPEYQQLIYNQKYKSASSTNYMYDKEKNIINEILLRCDMKNIGILELSMSKMLKEFLIKYYNPNNQEHKRIINLDANLEREINMFQEIKKMISETNNFDEIINNSLLDEYIDSKTVFNFGKLEDESSQFIKISKKYKKIDNYLETIGYLKFGSTFYSVMINIALSNKTEDEDKLIEEYGNNTYLNHNENTFNILKYLIKKHKNFFEKNKNKSIGEIISLCLKIDFSFKVMCSNICKNNNFDEALSKIKKLYNDIYNEYGIICLSGLYSALIEISKKYLSNNKKYEELKTKLEQFYQDLNIPNEFINSGCSVDSIIIKSVNISSMKVSEINDLIKTMHESNFNLGKNVKSKAYDEFTNDLNKTFDNLTNNEKLCFIKNYLACLNKGIFNAFKNKNIRFNDGEKMTKETCNESIIELNKKISKFLIYLYQNNKEMFMEFVKNDLTSRSLFSDIFENLIPDEIIKDELTEKEKKSLQENNNDIIQILEGSSYKEKLNKLSINGRKDSYIYYMIINKIKKSIEEILNKKYSTICMSDYTDLIDNIIALKESGYDINKLLKALESICNELDIFKRLDIFNDEFENCLNLLEKTIEMKNDKNNFLINKIISILETTTDDFASLYIKKIDNIINKINEEEYKSRLENIKEGFQNKKTR